MAPFESRVVKKAIKTFFIVLSKTGANDNRNSIHEESFIAPLKGGFVQTWRGMRGCSISIWNHFLPLKGFRRLRFPPQRCSEFVGGISSTIRFEICDGNVR
jgi:hypothetical protein